MSGKPLARKSDPNVRCCGICGRPGGIGSTLILRSVLGYTVPEGAIGYAHPKCIQRARRSLP